DEVVLLQPTFRRALTDPLEELERIDHRHRLPIASGLALVLIAEVRPHQRAAAEQSRLWRRRATLGFAVYYQHPARHPDQADGRLEPHHPHDRATDRRRAYRSRQSGRHGRHPAELLLLAGQARERDHPGRGTRVPLPDGDARRDQRQPVRRRPTFVALMQSRELRGNYGDVAYLSYSFKFHTSPVLWSRPVRVKLG